MLMGKARASFSFSIPCLQLWTLVLLIQIMPAQAADELAPDAVRKAQNALQQLTLEVSTADTASSRELKDLRSEIAGVRSTAQDCTQQLAPQLSLVNNELAVFVPESPAKTDSKKPDTAAEADLPSGPLSPAMAEQLREIQARKARLDELNATCKLMLLSTADLDSRVEGYLGTLRHRQLLTRGPTLFNVVRANLGEETSWLNFITAFAERIRDAGNLHPAQLGVALAIALLGLILGFMLKRWVHSRASKQQAQTAGEDAASGFLHALEATFAGYAPILLALGGFLAFLSLNRHEGADLPFFVTLLTGLLAYFAAAAFIRTLLNPCPPAAQYLHLPASVAVKLSRRSRVLAVIALLRWLILELHAEGLINDIMFALIRQMLIWAWVLNVIWIAWLLRSFAKWRNNWTVLLLISVVLLTGALASGFGYVHLGALVIVGTAYSMGVIALTLVANQVLKDLFDGLDEGRFRWQKALRKVLGIEDDHYIPGLGWLQLFANLALWTGAALLLLRIWNTNEEITTDILDYFTEGFQAGGLTIVPLNLLGALLVLAGLLALTSWVKGQMSNKWLAGTRMEPSARDALVTAFGYVGTALAILFALAFAGISVANLAIVAGALSVGIGFGLQNIVNNFVSGIIMLVERPVRKGDWVVVGNTQGTVEAISVRTTTIRTFDRADVIVPNSDMISNQVTNWTLGSNVGRVDVPVGVGYGSDLETVVQTMLEVANNHPDVILNDPQLSKPYVLFLAFGDSSLNFELRVHVHDITRRMHVLSDLNTAIDAEFRKKGIEIPFPQRDINFRGPLQLGQEPK
jgi:small-conductance mechanosensitive channel